MTIQQLKYIIALNEKRHYVKAAEACFVTQPTLTVQVKKLEEEIGTTIFNRDKSPLCPTPIGEVLIARAKLILQEVNEFNKFAYEDRINLTGEYTLGIIPTIAPYLLPLFLEEFVKNHPELKLIIKEMNTNQIIEALSNGTLDLSILSTPIEDSRLREINLYQEPFFLYCKNSKLFKDVNGIDGKDLSPEKLLLLEEGHCFRNQVLNICEKKTEGRNNFTFESGSIQTIKNLVQAGLGYSLVPQLSIEYPYDEKFIKKFKPPIPTREVSIVVNKNFTREKLIENLLMTIKKNIPENLHKIDNYVRVRWKEPAI
ncbi:hydrogen peroxide-inducible genes activator [Tenacibaculum sp. M341]|uniref:hydrogen peroxide-inducible genes activator n=1 Tax=Tenacibaculum sp. M341 TaxID=2530339 RepID=UPI0010465F40|nr:hydrogen peroxide-inducible genes activator [Tenacibaculum sp. M341]TCI91376.1 hydrogen peroxide-inducible genes activator [Tenacibaculum sp. M341]